MTLLILVLAGCGSGIHGIQIDSQYQKYVQKFEEISGVRVEVSVLASDLPEKSYGRCTRYPIVSSVVQIDAKKWQHLDEPSREVIMFHELGHCVLGLGHVENTVMARLYNSVSEQYANDPEPYLEILKRP